MMSPLFRASLLACGFAAPFSSSLFADDAVQQKFGSWTVTIQAGVRAALPQVQPASSPIRLISQQETAPADAVEAFPPPTPAPESTAPAVAPAPMPQSPDEPAAFHIPGTTPAVVPVQLSQVQLYSQVYNSIPFSRAEYVANPSYRHDATMEFLFGQLRPMTIQRSTSIIKQRSGGGMMNGPAAYSPYGFNSYFYPFYNQPIWMYNLW